MGVLLASCPVEERLMFSDCARACFGSAQTRGRVGRDTGLLEPFLGCPSVKGKGVQATFEFRFQRLIHEPMAPDELVVRETSAHRHDLEVRLGTLGHAVHVTLVDHFQVRGGQKGLQTFSNAFSTAHGLALACFAHGMDLVKMRSRRADDNAQVRNTTYHRLAGASRAARERG